MNYSPNQENRVTVRGRRKPKRAQPADGRPFAADQEDERLVRALREKIELAVEECCVWPD